MKRSILSFAVTLSAAAGAWAQDGLTPTDVLEGGKVSASGRLQFATGQGDLKSGAVTADVDLDVFQVILQGAVGLGMGFEVEVALPYQFSGKSEIDAGGASTLEFEEIGFGDLVIAPIYRLLKDDMSGPQLIIGGIAVAPTGKDEPAEPKTAGVSGEEGGIGDGTWRFGAMAGISKRLGVAEPYLTVSWVSGGDSEASNIETERADVLTITFGAEFHLGDKTALDFRGSFEFIGEEVDKDTVPPVTETTEESHFQHSWQAQLYYTAGSGVTLVLGVAVVFIEDHQVDDDPFLPLDLEDTFIFGASVGVHINL